MSPRGSILIKSPVLFLVKAALDEALREGDQRVQEFPEWIRGAEDIDANRRDGPK
jgi:hypothetical protein